MTLSDQLSDLASRAKHVQDRAAAAQSKAKADLEAEVEEARDSAQARADALRTRAQTRKGKISAWWDNVQKTWHDHLAAVRKGADDRKAAHDIKSMRKAAERADEDAAFAVDYAFAAIEEAQYAVLDADLAHRDVDELARA
jgi:hypothetical protein